MPHGVNIHAVADMVKSGVCRDVIEAGVVGRDAHQPLGFVGAQV